MPTLATLKHKMKVLLGGGEITVTKTADASNPADDVYALDVRVSNPGDIGGGGSSATGAKQDEQTLILQSIDDNTDGLETASTAIIAAVDGLEAASTSILGAVDGLETSSASILAAVDGLEGFTDGVETGIGAPADLAATSSVGTFNLIQVVKGIFATLRVSNNATLVSALTFGSSLTAIANAAIQSWTEARAVLLSVDLAGFLRVRTYKGLVNVTPVLDTSAYAAGDVLWVPIIISNLFHVADAPAELVKIKLTDKGDIGDEIVLYFLDANVSLGTINSAPSITDANADNIVAIVPVPAAGWYDVGGAKVQEVSFSPKMVRPVAASRDLYVGAILPTGTPTHGASDITMVIGVV